MRTLDTCGLSLSLVLLAACGGPAEDGVAKAGGPSACAEQLAGGDTRIELFGTDTCFSCGNSDLAKIIDNDPNSAGQISIAGPAENPEEGITVRVIAQHGVIFPGGTDAVFVGSYPSADFVGSTYMRALLDGAVVSEGRIEAHVVGGYLGADTPSKRTFSIPVSGPYNQIELTLGNYGLGDAGVGDSTIYFGAGSSTLDIYEVCSGLSPTE